MRFEFNPTELSYLVNRKFKSNADFARALVVQCDGTGLKPSAQLVSQWLDGKSRPKAEYLPYMAYLLGVKIEDFYKRVA